MVGFQLTSVITLLAVEKGIYGQRALERDGSAPPPILSLLWIPCPVTLPLLLILR